MTSPPSKVLPSTARHPWTKTKCFLVIFLQLACKLPRFMMFLLNFHKVFDFRFRKWPGPMSKDASSLISCCVFSSSKVVIPFPREIAVHKGTSRVIIPYACNRIDSSYCLIDEAQMFLVQ